MGNSIVRCRSGDRYANIRSRHGERSEAIQRRGENWIASSLSLLAMTSLIRLSVIIFLVQLSLSFGSPLPVVIRLRKLSLI
jgi:hypothetical protein